MANESLRTKAKAAGVRWYSVAEALGISEATMTRMLRHELKDGTRREIERTIDRLGGEMHGKDRIQH